MSHETSHTAPVPAGLTFLRFDGAAWRWAATLGIAVMMLSMFGILTRPLGYLAAIWPANAVLLGLLIANPRFSSLPGWICAFFGYIIAGLMAGDALITNLWLTVGNMSGVATGYLLFARLPEEERQLRQPSAILNLFVIAVVASLVSALIGCSFGAFIRQDQFSGSITTSFRLWAVGELYNFVVTLPVILTGSAILSRAAVQKAFGEVRAHPVTLLPFIAVALSVAASIAIGGAGAIAFSVPALLWCALVYGLFPVSVIVMLFSATMAVAESLGYFYVPDAALFIDSTTSFRLGITMLGLGPLALTSIAMRQRELLASLDEAVTRDSLTGILARGAYLERNHIAERKPRPDNGRGIAVLMIDIDHFKQLNDRHGHAAGDTVLTAVTATIAGELRSSDLFGRLGGEEFAATLFSVAQSDACNLAERLRHAVEELEIPVTSGEVLRTTISLGLAHSPAASYRFADELPRADAALYRAKAAGRNRLMVAEPGEAGPHSVAAE